MSLSSRVKAGLRKWTISMAGADLEARLEATRPPGEFGVDPFGYDPDYALSAVAPLVWLYKHYFRVECHGLAKVPPGRVFLIPNHSGQLPFDGAMIGIAMLIEALPPRGVRTMVEKWVATLPYVSTTYSRVGSIVGTPDNCRRLLLLDQAVLAFPEGMKAITKPYAERYQLQPFGLGFMRLALETGTPIVPVGVVGAEEQAPALVDLKGVARVLGLPSLPVTPWGVPLPLPVKYHLHFGDPLSFQGSPDEDDAELERKVEVVRGAIRGLLERGLAERKGVFS